MSNLLGRLSKKLRNSHRPDGLSLSDDGDSTKWRHPASFYCPISRECMHDPVILEDGHSYERRYIEEWLQLHNTSPVSGLQLSRKDVVPNHALRNAVKEYFEMVFEAQTNAIRDTMLELPSSPSHQQQALQSSAALQRTIHALVQSSLLMTADLNLESMLKQIMEQAKGLLAAEVASIFLLDAERKTLYSTVNSTGGELRIPVSQGIAGHVATTGKPAIVFDAYSDARFDRGMDARTGFRTRSILCVPLKVKNDSIIGVAQLINKVGMGVSDMQAATTEAENPAEPVAFTANDLHFFQVFASQAATAIAGSGALSDLNRSESTEAPSPMECGNLPSPKKALLSLQKGGSRSSSEDDGAFGPSLDEECLKDVDDDEYCMGAVHSEIVQRQVESSTEEAAHLLDEAYSSWRFDALSLTRVTDRPLATLGNYLFCKTGLVEQFDLDKTKLMVFLSEIDDGYGDNPYHNSTHASSVVHLVHAMLSIGGMLERTAPALGADPGLVRMACLIAAVVHDYEHPGVSNDFLVNSKSSRALRYNDQHVNEQHHVAAAFDVLSREDCNFLEKLDAKDFKKLRTIVIRLVVGTDMAEHGATMKAFKELVGPATSHSADSGGADRANDLAEGFTPTTEKDALLFLTLVIKCADLGHLTLSWDDHVDWVDLLEMEFFAQGDREKELGLTVSFLMDRDKPGASKTQVGFFDFMVLPLFRAFTSAAPECRPLLEGVEDNYEVWQQEDAAAFSFGRTKSMGCSPLNSAAVENLRAFGKGGLESLQKNQKKRTSFRV